MSNMIIKKLIILIGVTIHISIFAQYEDVESKVYSWQGDILKESANDQRRLTFAGSTIDLEYLKVFSIVIKSGKSFQKDNSNSGDEMLLIFKEGELEFNLNEKKMILGPGSVAVLFPDEEYQINNITESDAAFYLFKYKSKAPVEIDRGLAAGGSFAIDWNDLEFHPHDRGGIRQYFERATAMFHRFEMHVTTLKPGINSHDPHIHTSDEMVLMIDGNSTLQVGETFFDATEGDLIFLGADKPHALNNNSDRNCMYFAFHGE